PTTIIEESNANRNDRIHPTQKPVALFEYLIKTYTNKGETVLDNCMGSGTTAIACMNTERNFIGFELDGTYYGKSLERIKNHTTIIEESNANSNDRIHPTQKPVALFEYLIKTYTNKGETVLDNCMGSGTTAIACMNTERNFIGFELDGTYYGKSLERIKNHT